ncbi:transglutaminase domain-containing protein [Salarchaeum sp. III]|uniref:transglutaminase domain-containing protein n=1 Tax=Salarchaeum sp. III TaxID=3107927 RepID=UPI002EDB6FC5
MADGTSLSADGGGRSAGRALLAAAVVVGVVLATGVAPAFGSVAGGAPLASLLPVLNPSAEAGSSGSAGSGLSGGGLGALNAGSETGVGGDLASNDSAFRSLNDEVHFVVESQQPAYWRTNAYTTYTGTGWSTEGEQRAYDPPVASRDGNAVSYRVTLRQAATSLPTVWATRTVNANTDLSVTPTNGVVADSRLPAGTTYSGTSVRPPDDPDVLRSLSTDYPSGVESTYTRLPEESRDALTPITDDITAGAETPYDAATRVENWLESNKEYSLNVSQPPGEHIATEFAVEMEKGYCEYFATTMAAMLRTQGIPARYVVGYSTGQQTGEDEYTVRAMNAHAWVEVYFPDAGWVRFDPTPASERLSQENQALQNQTGSGYQTTTPPTTTQEPSSGDESTTTPTGTTDSTTTTDGTTGGTTTDGTTDDGSSTDGDTPADDGNGSNTGDDSQSGTDDSQSDSGLSTALNRTPVPGASVEVTVSNANGPVAGVGVFFNGERVGVTDENGTVVATVPYARELAVRTETETVVAETEDRSDGFAFTSGTASIPTEAANNSSTYAVNTNASVSLLGRTVTGNEVTVVAAVDGVPVRDAAVLLNDEQVATTNRSGRARVTLPAEPGNATVRVERDPVNGSTTVRLERLTLSGEPSLPLALPGAAATVTATLNGTPVGDVPVFLDGEQVGVTGADGTVRVSLPVASSAAVTATAYGQERTLTFDGLFLHAGGAALGLLGVLAGGVYGLRRYGTSPRGLLAWLAHAAVAVARGAANLVVALAGRAVAAVQRALDAVANTLRGRRSPRELAAAFAAWLAALRVDAVEQTRSVRERFGSGAESGESDEVAAARRTLRDAWNDFLAATSVRRPSRHTPGELAAHAVERDDLPADAVREVRDAFRSVEYGQRDPDDRLPAVEEAMREIEAAQRPEDAEGGAD